MAEGLQTVGTDDRPPEAKAIRDCSWKTCRVETFRPWAFGSVPHENPLCPSCRGPGMLNGKHICGRCGAEIINGLCPNKPDQSGRGGA